MKILTILLCALLPAVVFAGDWKEFGRLGDERVAVETGHAALPIERVGRDKFRVWLSVQNGEKGVSNRYLEMDCQRHDYREIAVVDSREPARQARKEDRTPTPGSWEERLLQTYCPAVWQASLDDRLRTKP